MNTDLIICEVDAILSILEAAIPANPLSRDNKKLADKTEEILAAYFAQIEQAFPFDEIEKIYSQNVPVAEAGPIGETGDIIDPILKTFRAKILTDLIGQHVRAYLTGSAELVSWGVTKGGKPILYEGPPMQQAIEYAQKHCATMVTKMDTETKRLIAQTVSDGIKNKRGIPGLARDLRKQFADMTKERARVIARTETADALEQGFMDRSKDMGVTGKEWVVTEPCPICEANEAERVVPINHVFSSGHMRPPAHPNCRCLPGDTLIDHAGIIRVYRRWYEGDLIEITTALGNKLSGTPNHPIMTDAGWVELGMLKEGDNAISALTGKRMLAINPDVNHIPAQISDIFDSLSIVSLTERVVGAPMDFHGDGRENQVDIVTIDNALSNRMEATSLEHLEHLRLSLSHRQMSLASNNGSLVGVKESKAVGLATIAPRDIGSTQPGSNDIPVNSKTPCQTKLGFSRDVAINDKSVIQPCKGASAYTSMQCYHGATTSFIPEKPLFYQDVSDTPISSMIPAADRFDAFPCDIIPDRIVNIRRTSFSHYVYNLQTVLGFYAANGIIAHNCALAPVMLEEEGEK